MQRSVLLVLECEVNELTLGYGCVEFETLGYGGAKMHKIYEGMSCVSVNRCSREGRMGRTRGHIIPFSP